MKRQIQLLLEYNMLNPFSVVFDWGDAHMECLNQHIGHFLDLLPEFSEFGSQYLLPLARGISPENVKRILTMVKPKIPLLKHLSDSAFLRVLARVSKPLAPYLRG